MMINLHEILPDVTEEIQIRNISTKCGR